MNLAILMSNNTNNIIILLGNIDIYTNTVPVTFVTFARFINWKVNSGLETIRLMFICRSLKRD